MIPSQGIGKIPVSPEHMKARLAQVEAEITLKQERLDSFLLRAEMERAFVKELGVANAIATAGYRDAMKRHADAEADLMRVDVARASMEAHILRAAIEESQRGDSGLVMTGSGLV